MSKRTLATTIRCDARQAAELVLFFKSREIKINSISDLLRRTIETLASIAISNGLARSVSTTDEAIEILRREDVIDLTKERVNRNFKTLLKDLSSEDIKIEGMSGSLNLQPSKEMLEVLQKKLDEEKFERTVIMSDSPNVVEDSDE